MQCPVCGLSQDEIAGQIGPLCDECIAIGVEMTDGPFPAFSPALVQTIERAVALLHEHGDEDARLECLLLALIDDPDAARVMQACGVDLDRLRAAIASSLLAADARAAATGPLPDASMIYRGVLRPALTRGQLSGAQEITGADVLLEVLSSTAAMFVQRQGMTWYDAVCFISHGIVKGGAASTAVEVVGDAQAATFTLVLLNDDFTPMEFVVDVLGQFFDMEHDDAVKLMLRVHKEGRADCGTYPAETAREKAAQVLEFARKHWHPLRCVLRA